jgi:hypothetical protein
MEYRNPIFTKNGLIDCELRHPVYGWVPFTCDPNDTGAEFDTAALFADMKPHAAPFVPELVAPPTEEQVRAERNALLKASDWTQVVDAPVDQAAWSDYRQALRDLPAQEGFPYSVEWPTKPE